MSVSWIDLTGDGTRLVSFPTELCHDGAAIAFYLTQTAPTPPEAPAPDADEESP